MPALDAPLTLRVIAHLDFEVTNDRFDLRELFLILRRHVAARNRAAAVRTRRRDRCRVRFRRPAPGAGGNRDARNPHPLAVRDVRRDPAAGPWRTGPLAGARRGAPPPTAVSGGRSRASNRRSRVACCRSDAADPCPRARGASALHAAARSRRAGVESGRRIRSSGPSLEDDGFLLTTQELCHIPGKSTIQKVGSLLWLSR